MSPRRQPISLYRKCISYFVNKLNMLCCENGLNKPVVFEAIDYIKKYMPISFQAEIGEALSYETERLQKVLLPSQVQIVLMFKVRSLSVSGSVVQSGVLDNNDGSQLQILSLLYRGCRDTAVRLYGFLHTTFFLTHLTCTDFCNDYIMEIISKTCQCLVYLNLNACSEVTDDGILRLCGRQESMKECLEILNNKGCLVYNSRVSSTLKELKIKMTRVTEAGIAIIFFIMTNICLLCIPDIPMKRVFNFIDKIKYKPVAKNLKEFRAMETFDEHQLSVLISLFPNISYIQNCFVGNFESDLLRLNIIASLNKITSLNLCNVDGDALLIFLKSNGNQITYFQLYITESLLSQDQKLKITPNQIWSLGKNCPKLEFLYLKGYVVDNLVQEYITYDNGNQTLLFNKLETLKLEAIDLSEPNLMYFLFNCPNIKYLDIVLKDPHALQDRLIHVLLDKGLWNNLIKIRILNSPLTSKTMIRLINECPYLKELGCITTWLIAKQQVLEFKERIKRQNLDIDIYL